MTDVDDFLEHYGVKGMKWGQRNAKRGKLRRGATKANVALKAGSKVIDKGEENLIFLPMKHRAQAASNTQGRVLSEARRVNKDPKFKGKDIKKNKPLREAYHKEVETRAKKIYQEELSKARLQATVDFIEAVTTPRGDKMKFSAPSDRIRHAEDTEVLLTLNLTRDELDHIVDISIVEDELAQSDPVDEFLAHYGVKGMKWGVRREERRTARAAPSAVNVKVKPARRGSQDIRVTNKSGGRVTTAGGKRNVATKDAVDAAVARQKAKKSTTNALSNKELKAAVERMNLEQQFNKLTKQDAKANRGKKFIEALFKAGTGDLVGAAASAASAASPTTTRATQVVPRKAIGS